MLGHRRVYINELITIPRNEVRIPKEIYEKMHLNILSVLLLLKEIHKNLKLNSKIPEYLSRLFRIKNSL